MFQHIAHQDMIETSNIKPDVFDAALHGTDIWLEWTDGLLRVGYYHLGKNIRQVIAI